MNRMPNPPTPSNHANLISINRVRVRAARATLDSRSLMQMCIVLVCGLTLALGFVKAAAQHVAAINYGYEEDAMRREHRRLIDEQRQLQLALSQAVAPPQLEQSARRLGLTAARAEQLETDFASHDDVNNDEANFFAKNR